MNSSEINEIREFLRVFDLRITRLEQTISKLESSDEKSVFAADKSNNTHLLKDHVNELKSLLIHPKSASVASKPVNAAVGTPNIKYSKAELLRIKNLSNKNAKISVNNQNSKK